jgi:hypothetical protein
MSLDELPTDAPWPSFADRALELAQHAPPGRVKAELAIAAAHLTGMHDPAFAIGFLPEKLRALKKDIDAYLDDLQPNEPAGPMPAASVLYGFAHVTEALLLITRHAGQPPASGAHRPSPEPQALPASGV